jgi:site-specific DNA recombinase
MGEMPILSGMLFCADCGAKLYQVRGRGWEHDKEYFVCATYRKVKGGCSSHQIRNVVVEELLLDGIRQITAFARAHEDEFVQMVTSKTKMALDKSLRDDKRELEQSQARIAKLDDIIQRLYEDNISGKVSDERFAKMTANYEAEQHTLESRVAELKAAMTAENESSTQRRPFSRACAEVHGYTGSSRRR